MTVVTTKAFVSFNAPVYKNILEVEMDTIAFLLIPNVFLMQTFKLMPDDAKVS